MELIGMSFSSYDILQQDFISWMENGRGGGREGGGHGMKLMRICRFLGKMGQGKVKKEEKKEEDEEKEA